MAIFSIAYAFAYVGGFLAAAAGLSMATAVAIGTAVGYIGAGLAMSALARKLSPRPKVPSVEVKATITQTDAPRRVYVGRYLVGGIKAFFDVSGATLHQLIVAAHGQVDGFEAFVVDGRTVSVSSGGGFYPAGSVVSGPTFGGGGLLPISHARVVVQMRDGASLGGDYSSLRSAFPSLWTAAHKIEGQATYYVRSTAPPPEDFQKRFPKGEHTVYQWVIRGQRVVDSRTGVSSWRDNAALVQRHYLTHPDGFRLAAADVSAPSINAMADWCDLPVAQNGGGTQPNMRLWGYWTLDEAPASVLDRMAASSGLRPYEMQDGRIGLVGGPFGVPACTITAKDIREIQTTAAIDEREGYNSLRVTYLSGSHRFEMVEADPTEDLARQAVEGVIAQEMALEMCPNLSQAKRLAKRQMHDDNRARVEIITNLVGLKARWPRHHGQRHTILLDYRPEDGSGRVVAGEYEVLDHEFDPVALECRIVLAAVDRASESWTPGEEGDPPPPLPAETGNPPPAFTGAAAVVAQGGVNTIRVTATAPSGRDDLGVEARYRETGAPDWTAMTSAGLSATSAALSAGSYEVEGRWTGVFDGVDDWHPLGTVTVD